jgi:Protein of unknown function (DUF5133)
MLMAHPTVLRTLVERYETLQALTDEQHTNGSDDHGITDPRIGQQLQDTVYTLCVSTGTREINAALAAARQHIERDIFNEGVVRDMTAA